MAHNIDMTTGRAAFAYAGERAWHGLGQKLDANASMAQWAEASGLNFEVLRAVVEYQAGEHGYKASARDHVLFRSDNGERLGIVSDEYKVVQPRDALEFFREFCESNQLQMETAGALQGGAIYWAMARTGREANFARSGLDQINQYVLLSTSADGSRATDGSINSTRVVCNNTLRMSDRTAKSRVKVRHSSVFDPRALASQLGLVDLDRVWEQFAADMRKLQQIEVSAAEATAFFSNLLRPAKPAAPARNAQSFEELLTGPATLSNEARTIIAADVKPERAIRGLADLEQSYVAAPGACPGTAYGALQAVTHFIDHVRGSDAGRQQSAWFGQGETLKATAFEQLLAKA